MVIITLNTIHTVVGKRGETFKVQRSLDVIAELR